MTAAIVRNKIILLGGAGGPSTNLGFHKEVFCLSLDNLPPQAASYVSELWQRLPSTPLRCFTTALAYNGALLAIGGRRSHCEKFSHIIMSIDLEKSAGSREEMCLATVYRCACTVLLNGEIFIAGGATSSSHSTDNLQVTDIAMVLCNL